MPWILDLNDVKSHAEDGRWELGTLSDGSVIVRFYTKHGSIADVVAAQAFAKEGTELIACGQPDRDAQVLAEAQVEMLTAIEAVLPYLPDANDAKNYASTNEGRASNFQVAAIKLREVFSRNS
jgi:hypothetical protein